MQHPHYKAEHQACWCVSTGQAIEPEVYPRPDGSVYICGSPEHIALPNDPNTIQVDPKSVEDLKEVARSVSSKLSEAPLEVGQSCFLPISPDGLPVMGKVPGVQGAYIASGKSSPPPPLPPLPAPSLAPWYLTSMGLIRKSAICSVVWHNCRSISCVAICKKYVLPCTGCSDSCHMATHHCLDWMCCLRSRAFFCLTSAQGNIY